MWFWTAQTVLHFDKHATICRLGESGWGLSTGFAHDETFFKMSADRGTSEVREGEVSGESSNSLS